MVAWSNTSQWWIHAVQASLAFARASSVEAPLVRAAAKKLSETPDSILFPSNPRIFWWG